jgi:hypothetical protein
VITLGLVYLAMILSDSGFAGWTRLIFSNHPSLLKYDILTDWNPLYA